MQSLQQYRTFTFTVYELTLLQYMWRNDRGLGKKNQIWLASARRVGKSNNKLNFKIAPFFRGCLKGVLYLLLEVLPTSTLHDTTPSCPNCQFVLESLSREKCVETALPKGYITFLCRLPTSIINQIFLQGPLANLS